MPRAAPMAGRAWGTAAAGSTRMFDTLIFLGQTSWRGDHHVHGSIALVYDQYQGTHYGTSVPVPAAAASLTVATTGIPTTRLQDPAVRLQLSLDTSSDSVNWIGSNSLVVVGDPAVPLRDGVAAQPNFGTDLPPVGNPVRPLFVRPVGDTPGLLSYGLLVTFYDVDGNPL